MRGISFKVEEGEILGYISPNGAGKTTTLKILSGVLYPTEGEVKVLGFNPINREKGFLKKISFVMSGKGILEEIGWDLSVIDTLLFIKEMYKIPQKEFVKNLEELFQRLEISELLNKSVRQLSYGQRMKAEVMTSLLWMPQVVFLDEPTIGLNIFSQKALRNFLKDCVSQNGVSIILTSHYMKDIEELADRVIMIDKGEIIFEGDLSQLYKTFSSFEYIKLSYGDFNIHDLLENMKKDIFGEIKESEEEIILRTPESKVNEVIKILVNNGYEGNILIEDVDLEEIIYEYYKGDKS